MARLPETNQATHNVVNHRLKLFLNEKALETWEGFEKLQSVTRFFVLLFFFVLIIFSDNKSFTTCVSFTMKKTPVSNLFQTRFNTDVSRFLSTDRLT